MDYSIYYTLYSLSAVIAAAVEIWASYNYRL